MTSSISIFNALLTFLFGLVYEPLRWLGPLWSLVGISCVCGILMVWVFGKISNQRAIQRTRDRLSSELIGLRLFKDDLRVFFGIQFQVLVWTLRYLRHSLIPMLILVVPTVLILVQLNLHYGSRPLRVGERTLVKVRLRNSDVLARGTEITLQAPESVRVETQGVRVGETKEVCWRIRGSSPGRFELVVSDGRTSVTKNVAVGGRLEGVSSVRTGEHWVNGLLYPGEALLPRESIFESIEILYPKLDILILGRRASWLVLFLVLSLGFGYAFKGALRVQI